MKKLLNALYITTPERWLSLDGENVVISEGGDTVGRVPLHNLESIHSFGGVGATPALLGKCAEYGIGLNFLSRSGKFLCSVIGETTGNVFLRREQYRIADDEERSLDIAKKMIVGKIFNSRYSAERTLRDHSLRINTEKFERVSSFLLNSARKCDTVLSKDELRGIEGEAASVYFGVFDEMILQQKKDFVFTTRSKRPPLDRVNALLSFSYIMMTSMCTSALYAAGLDPFVGFMHTDRPGRRSLALDLLEEFRSVICDRFVLSQINKKQVSAGDFDQREDGAVLLNENGKKIFLSAWQRYKQEEIIHPFIREKVQRGLLPYVQAQLLARYIRGDLDCYPVFLRK